jgi:hypothetical protein
MNEPVHVSAMTATYIRVVLLEAAIIFLLWIVGRLFA